MGIPAKVQEEMLVKSLTQALLMELANRQARRAADQQFPAADEEDQAGGQGHPGRHVAVIGGSRRAVRSGLLPGDPASGCRCGQGFGEHPS